MALDNAKINNQRIKASFGWSKFCTEFIKSKNCNSNRCNGLHEMKPYILFDDKNYDENLKNEK